MEEREDQAPLAVYRERLAQVGRVIELYDDRVEVRARWLFGGQYRNTIRLADLVPKPREFHVRQRLFKRALALGLLAAAAAVVCMRPEAGMLNHPAVIWPLWILAGGLLAVAARAFPKVLFNRFVRHDGKPGLDIAAAGPDRRAFAEFVDRVARQVRKAGRGGDRVRE